MKRIAVVFPGIGYTLDKPLLYYGRKLLKKSGYEEIKLLDYTGLGSVSIKGNADKMAKAFDVIYSKTEEYLKDIHWEEYDEILFLSKSIGTITASAYAEKFGLNSKDIRHVLYTPLEYTFAFHPKCAVAFTGSADSWCIPSDIIKLAEEQNIPINVYENADHSLETGDILHYIDTLRDVMEKTADFIRGTDQ